MRAARTPTVTAPGSVERSAVIARPDAERVRLPTTQAAVASSTSRPTIMVRLSPKSSGPISGGCTRQPLLSWFEKPSSWKNRYWAMKARAIVDSARGSPPSRRAGSETTTPSAVATRVPAARAARNGQPWLSAHPAVNPAAVTNAAWARLTMPPMPVTMVNDSNTRPRARPRAISACQYESANPKA